MNTRIVYIDPFTNILAFIVISPDMFDEKSDTRLLLTANGVTFSSNEEIINWVAKKDVPKGLPYYLVPASNFPVSFENRDKWYYDSETNSVKDS